LRHYKRKLKTRIKRQNFIIKKKNTKLKLRIKTTTKAKDLRTLLTSFSGLFIVVTRDLSIELESTRVQTRLDKIGVHGSLRGRRNCRRWKVWCGGNAAYNVLILSGFWLNVYGMI